MTKIASHIPPLIHLCNMYNILVLVDKSNFTLFFKVACNAYLSAVRKLAGYSSYISSKYLNNSQIFELTIMYPFEYTNHDIDLNYLFKKNYKPFLYASNLH